MWPLFRIHAGWDPDAAVWCVSESDVLGLAAEGSTIGALIGKLRILVPEVVVINRHLIGFDPGPRFPMPVTTARQETLWAVARWRATRRR